MGRSGASRRECDEISAPEQGPHKHHRCSIRGAKHRSYRLACIWQVSGGRCGLPPRRRLAPQRRVRAGAFNPEGSRAVVKYSRPEGRSHELARRSDVDFPGPWAPGTAPPERTGMYSQRPRRITHPMPSGEGRSQGEHRSYKVVRRCGPVRSWRSDPSCPRCSRPPCVLGRHPHALLQPVQLGRPNQGA